MRNIEITRQTYSETIVRIIEPRASRLNTSDFRLAGTAHVKMHVFHRISYGNDHRDSERDYEEKDAIKKVEILIGSSDPQQATLRPQGNGMHWYLDVKNAPEGSSTITARAIATVTETTTEENLDTNEVETDSNVVHDTVEQEKNIDIQYDVAPDLRITRRTPTRKPPWQVAVKGTALHKFEGFEVWKVEWSLDAGVFQLVRNASGDWSEWDASIPLPNRSQEHKIRIRAFYNSETYSEESFVIPADTKPPDISFKEPAEDRHAVLWRDDNSENDPIDIIVKGMAVDADTTVRNVRWRLNDGEWADADNEGGEWAIWSANVQLRRSGTHIVQVSATDVVGNNADDNPTQLTIIAKEEL